MVHSWGRHQGKMLTEESTNLSLESYQELQLRVTRFSAVEQQLVAARDQLDQELAIYSRLNLFNTQALREMSSAEFTNLVSESLVDIFEFEIGLCCPLQADGHGPLKIGVQGATLTPAAAVSFFAILNGGLSCARGEVSFLNDQLLSELRQVLPLKQGLVTVLQDAQGQPLVALVGGITEAGAATYEPIRPERAKPFLVFAQSVAANLSNRQGRNTIRRQIDEIRLSEQRLTLATEGADLGVWDWNIATKSLAFNERWNSMLGYQRLELSPSIETWRSLIDPAQLPDWDSALEAHLLGKSEKIDFEMRMRSKFGEWRWVQARGRVVEWGDKGEAVRALGTLLDITDRHRAAAALLQSEAEFRAAFDVASIGMAQADPATGRWLRVNERMCSLTGYSREEMLKMRVSEVTHPEDRARDWELFQDVVRGRRPNYHMEKRYLRKDGREVWVNVNMTVIRDASGVPVRTWAAIEDITDRRRLEASLRQAQKLEAIGQLAGGVAHDFNNILAAMLLQIESLRLEAGLDEAALQSLHDLEAGAKRAAALTRQLVLFGRKSVVDLKPLDLNASVTNIARMLRRLIGETQELHFEPTLGLPLTEADAGMVDQVLMNLVVNARDAQPQGGRISIRLDAMMFGVGPHPNRPDRRAGRFVRISVQDHGSGMDQETLRHIFEPFFTTKEQGKGTGMGLATVHGIVAQHQGWIEVDSQLGQGTEFQVFLPACSQKTTELAIQNVSRNPRQGNETILLVEDDKYIRQLVGMTLQRHGYKVHQAADGIAALKLWKERNAEIDLLLSDMVMPEGISGLDLAEQLQALKPDLKVIISSGYSDEIHFNRSPGNSNIAYLAKPYTPNMLTETVRKTLDSQACSIHSVAPRA